MKSILPNSLYTGQQVKQGEQQAASMANVAMYTLMCRAGEATYNVLKTQYSNARRLAVLVGTGNNGGDGFVVAKLAKSDGLNVALYVVGHVSKISGDAHLAMQEWLECGGEIVSVESLDWARFESDVIVDGLLGTGLAGEVRGALREVISGINLSKVPVVAIDVPSGLCSDTGRILGSCVSAQHTVTFIGVKQGLATGQARAVTGQLHFAGLGVEKEFAQCIAASSEFIDESGLRSAIAKRSPTAHKGHHGRVTCLGGNQGYGGAIRLCATATARGGAGLVRTLCHPSSAIALQVACPEVMTLGWMGENESLLEALNFADVIALGPGLGTDQWAQDVYSVAATQRKPKVVDADGLNLLGQAPNADPMRVITPHPGEAARLLNCSVKEIEQDRFQAVITLHRIYGGVIVLKGAGSLVYDGQRTYVCQAGNAGMATGGMGDVLTGIIAALIAQGLALLDAAKYGVLIHAMAGDEMAQKEGQIGMLASDVIQAARRVINSQIEGE